MSKEIIEFYAEDGIALNGYINKVKGETDKVLIETHGMSSNCLKNREKIIAENLERINIDTICFNNRGNGIVNFIKNKNGRKELCGTAFENVEESYFDILGAIKYAISLGYKNIYLQGHSLGATKVLYTYTKMKEEENINLKYIKGIILLSFVDVSAVINNFITEKMIIYAKNKEKENKELELMPYNSFLCPISVKNYLKYVKMKDAIDPIKLLNAVDVPIFMRWGNIMELIEKSAEEHSQIMNQKIKNKFKDISFIDGANHSYEGKEQILAEEISKFINKIVKSEEN